MANASGTPFNFYEHNTTDSSSHQPMLDSAWKTPSQNYSLSTTRQSHFLAPEWEVYPILCNSLSQQNPLSHTSPSSLQSSPSLSDEPHEPVCQQNPSFFPSGIHFLQHIHFPNSSSYDTGPYIFHPSSTSGIQQLEEIIRQSIEFYSYNDNPFIQIDQPLNETQIRTTRTRAQDQRGKIDHSHCQQSRQFGVIQSHRTFNDHVAPSQQLVQRQPDNGGVLIMHRWCSVCEKCILETDWAYHRNHTEKY